MKNLIRITILLFTIIQFSIKCNAGQNITLCINESYAPFEFVNSSGGYDGFIVDIFKAINEINHFDYQIKVKNKAFNLHTAQIDSTEITTTLDSIHTDNKYVVSEPIVYIDNDIITHPNSNINSLSDIHKRKVLIIDGSPIINQLHAKNIYPEFIYIRDIHEGLRLLSSGKYDVMICSNDVAYYYINKYELPNLLVKRLFCDPLTIRFVMIDTPSNRETIHIINTALTTIRSNGVYDKLFANRFFPDSKDFTQKAELWLLIVGICLILILLAYIIYIKRIYKNEKELIVNKPIDNDILIENIKKIAESSPTPTILFNTEGRIIFINKAGYDLTNFNKHVNLRFGEHTMFDYTILDSEMIDDLKNNKSIHFVYDLINEIQLFNYLGDYILPHNRIFDIHIHPTCNYNSSIKGYLTYIYDITDLRNARYSNIKYLTSLSQISDNNFLDFCYYDSFNNLFYTFSQNKENSTEASYEKILSMIYPLHRSIFIDEFLSLLNGEKSKAYITLKMLPNDTTEYIDLNVTLNAIKVDNNTIIGISIITSPITNTSQHKGITPEELEENLSFIQRNSGYQFFKYDYKKESFTINSKDNITKSYSIKQLIDATHPDDRKKLSEILDELKTKQTEKAYLIMRFSPNNSQEYNFYEIHMQIPKYNITSTLNNKNIIIGIYHNINSQYSQIHELETFRDCTTRICEMNQMEYIEYYIDDIEDFILTESVNQKYGINDYNFIDYMNDESKLKIKQLIDSMNNQTLELEHPKLTILCPITGEYNTFEILLFPVEDSIKQKIFKYIGFMKKVTQ